MAWIEAARRIVEHGAEVHLADGSWRPWTDFDYPSEADEVTPWLTTEAESASWPPDGAVMLDAFTASMLVQVHDALSEANRAKFAAMPLVQAVSVGWRLVEKTRAA